VIIRIFAAEVRRSPSRYWFPVMVLASLAMLFGRSTGWMGVWPATSATVGLTTFVLGPLSAGAAAWACSRWSAPGLADEFSAAARPWWSVHVTFVVAQFVYPVMAYVVTVVCAAWVTAPSAGTGFLWPSYLALGFGNLATCIGIGIIVGTLLPSRNVTPICCTLGTLVFQGVRRLPLRTRATIT